MSEEPIEYMSIEEWKERYGQPGNGDPDSQGRIWGFFPTEPCFCEDAPEE